MTTSLTIGARAHQLNSGENRQLIREDGEWYSRVGFVAKLEAEGRVNELREFASKCSKRCDLAQ